jgi:hypothetical protein
LAELMAVWLGFCAEREAHDFKRLLCRKSLWRSFWRKF